MYNILTYNLKLGTLYEQDTDQSDRRRQGDTIRGSGGCAGHPDRRSGHISSYPLHPPHEGAQGRKRHPASGTRDLACRRAEPHRDELSSPAGVQHRHPRRGHPLPAGDPPGAGEGRLEPAFLAFRQRVGRAGHRPCHHGDDLRLRGHGAHPHRGPHRVRAGQPPERGPQLRHPGGRLCVLGASQKHLLQQIAPA